MRSKVVDPSCGVTLLLSLEDKSLLEESDPYNIDDGDKGASRKYEDDTHFRAVLQAHGGDHR